MIFIGCIFVFIIRSAIWHQIYKSYDIDPKDADGNLLAYQAKELSKKANDSQMLNDMLEVYDAFERYYQKYNRYPWQDSLTKKTQITTLIDNNIFNKLVDSDLMKTSFRDKILNTGKTIQLFVNEKGKIYLCANPESKKNIEISNKICVNDLNIKDTVVCNQNQKQMCVSSDIGYFNYNQ